jgi:hypothetical protein
MSLALFLATLLFGAAPVQLPEGFVTARASYREQTVRLEADATAKLRALDENYLRSLEALDADFKAKGELDPLLEVRKETERFKARRVVTTFNIVTTPPTLGTLQQQYIDTRAAVEHNRKLGLARLAQAYLDNLDKLKRALTQQDKLDAAVAVQKEQETIRATADLSPLAQPQPAQPTPPPVVDPAGPTAGKAAPDSITVTVSDHGLLTKDVVVYLQTEDRREVIEAKTDTLGKAVFRADPKAKYRIVLVSERHESVEIKEAAAGNAYLLRTSPRARGTGAVEIKKTGFTLPDIGLFKPGLTWNFGKEHGQTYAPANSKVKIQDAIFGTQANAFIVGHHDQPDTVSLGNVRYEVRFFKTGRDRFMVEYKKQ